MIFRESKNLSSVGGKENVVSSMKNQKVTYYCFRKYYTND